MNHVLVIWCLIESSWNDRGYRNGFVWQDLTENDFIYPTNGHEYVLKGSELLHLLIEEPPILNQLSESSSSGSSRSSDNNETSKKVDSPVIITRRRNQSCSSIDMYEYKLYKTTANSVSAGESVAANASTQTGSNRHQKLNIVEKESVNEIEDQQHVCQNETIELSRCEISPPLSDSSPETLETLMKADKRLMLRTGALNGSNSHDQATGNSLSCKMKASTVLMQLISCGSFPFKDCGATTVKDHGVSLVSSYKSKLPRAEKESSSCSKVKLEEKEYFSGSLIQKKSESDDELIKLNRSFSCNADRYCSLFIPSSFLF